MSLESECDFFHLLNDHEREFICDWGMKSIKFPVRSDFFPCFTLWRRCFLAENGRLKMNRRDDPGKYDTIKIDASDGQIIISVQTGSSFNYFAELVS